MRLLKLTALISVCTSFPVFGQSELAIKFGTRDSISDISLSPDGKKIAYLEPVRGRATGLYIADADGSTTPKLILTGDAKPLRLSQCDWASNIRLVCKLYAIDNATGQYLSYTRLVAINADGTELKWLGQRANGRSIGVNQFSGSVIGWPAGDTGEVLMAQNYLPEVTIGTNLASSAEGLGVDRINTVTMKTTRVEAAKKDAVEYIADEDGNVRIMGMIQAFDSGQLKGVVQYFYRLVGEKQWKTFSKVDQEGNGMNPVAIDAKRNVAFAFNNKDGRNALFTIKLDESLASEILLAHDRVDVANTLRIGRNGRVIGADIVTDKRESIISDPVYKALGAKLSKALPGQPPVRFISSSRDENQLLLYTATDVDPGSYYFFDKVTKRLNQIFIERPLLENMKLAAVTPISYPAADGTMIPGYLTTPPGSTGKNLPTIIMPHGGPASRDEWGFDWIAQYFAALGYAVLQPNFRGSSGYGEDWYLENGFKSWRVAIGDVNDAAKWMISQGTADKSKMAIFGWSYGGYAALQSSVLEPDLFKAIVAVAPVTDLARLKEDSRGFTNFNLVSEYVGSGEHIASGSPRKQADLIKAPVLMFSGDIDLNVDIGHAKSMDAALRDKGKASELVVYPGLDHSLVDSAARADMLQKSSDFFKRTLGLP